MGSRELPSSGACRSYGSDYSTVDILLDALPAYRCLGHNYATIHLYREAERLSLCHRGHSFRRNDTDMNVFCFAERAHAEKFQARFGGEFIDPKDRPKWPRSRRLMWI
jgi:hypothetical protein